MSIEAELLGCPFCGATGVMDETAGSQASGGGVAYRVTCKQCHRTEFPWTSVRQEAVGDWNRRSPPCDLAKLTQWAERLDSAAEVLLLPISPILAVDCLKSNMADVSLQMKAFVRTHSPPSSDQTGRG